MFSFLVQVSQNAFFFSVGFFYEYKVFSISFSFGDTRTFLLPNVFLFLDILLFFFEYKIFSFGKEKRLLVSEPAHNSLLQQP